MRARYSRAPKPRPEVGNLPEARRFRGFWITPASVLFIGLAGFSVPLRAQISPGELSRAHQDLDGPLRCKQCHGGRAGEMDAACRSCHGEIAKLVKENRGFHAGVRGEPCATCHPEHAGRDFELISWKEGKPERFDHTQTGWPLEGKHARTACRDCHRAEFQTSDVVPLIRRKNPGAGWLGLQRRCASCHEDVHRGTLSTDCQSCHGSDSWKPASKFDHAKCSYPLTGKHAAVKCQACHVPPPPDPKAAGNARALPTFKPLAHVECSPCHQDPHRGSLGAACSGCHTTADFHRIDQRSFRHDLTRFPLQGAHAAVACATCHDPVKAWGKKPPVAPCGACHQDAHAGTALLAGAPADCASCHSTAAYSPSTFTVERHRNTAYALDGKHAQVPCRSCHPKLATESSTAALGSAGILLRPHFAACRDCHGSAHGMQFASRKDGDACEGCHTVDGWRPSIFDGARHAALTLPLDGRHAAIECRACHGPNRPNLPVPVLEGEVGEAGVFLTLPDSRCVACHVDAHRGRWAPALVASAPSGSSTPQAAAPAGAPRDAVQRECRDCHDTRSFHPATTDVERHATFSYPLEGAHRAVPCQACHPELEHRPAGATLLGNAKGIPDLPFDRMRNRCADCHEDPHGGQFAGASGKDCQSCHDVERFRPAVRFDHDRDAAFPLRGGHEKVACAKCHPSGSGPDGSLRVLYRPLDRNCRSCHGNMESGGPPHPTESGKPQASKPGEGRSR